MSFRLLLTRPAVPMATALLLASALVACSNPEKPATSRAPAPADSAPAAPAPPANSFESGVRSMTGAIPRARDAAADMNQRSAENAAAANAVQ